MPGCERSNAVGAVLAGGRGRRLGGAKATVELAGRPLIEHALDAVVAAGLEPVVVAKPGSPLPALSCEVVREPERPSHPACGLVAALRASGDRPVVAVACDMPLLDSSLLAWLAHAPEPLVLVERAGRLQPFPGRYGAAALAPLERAVETDRPLRDTLARLAPRRLDAAELARFGPPERLLFNVNAPADLARASELLAESAGR